ncbi:MAG: hypothetical protein HY291_06055 [Planctomycetes bacterium]|nr:hypothetical protein [Planctomycetota bacterium]
MKTIGTLSCSALTALVLAAPVMAQNCPQAKPMPKIPVKQGVSVISGLPGTNPDAFIKHPGGLMVIDGERGTRAREPKREDPKPMSDADDEIEKEAQNILLNLCGNKEEEEEKAKKEAQADGETTLLVLKVFWALVTGPTTEELEKKYVPIYQKKMQGLIDRFKGTGDIAGVAKALYQLNEDYKSATGVDYFRYEDNDDAKDKLSYTDCDKAADLFKVRAFMCYGFVDMCGYIAGDQPKTGDGLLKWNKTSGVSKGDYPNFGTRFGVSIQVKQVTNVPIKRGDTDKPARGQVVTGIGRGTVNKQGYTHTAIGVGDGKVIGIGSGGFVETDMFDTFGYTTYSGVFVGDYSYGTTNTPAPSNPHAAPAESANGK